MSVPELFVKRPGLAARFEDARVLPNSFLAAVSRHRGKRRIYVLDFPAGVGDDDAIRGLLHGRNQPGPLDIVTFPAHFSPR